jgi:hypothetical protein
MATSLKLDAMNAAYQGEFERWRWARRPDPKGVKRDGYNLVRYNAPDLQRGEQGVDIIKLTRRECKDSTDAESWLRTYRGRAAMQAAITAGEKL